MQPIKLLTQAQYYLQYSTQLVYSKFLQYFPRFQLFNRFQKFVILNLTIFILFFIYHLVKSISIVKFYNGILKIIFKLPMIKAQVDKQLAKMRQQISNQFPQQCRSILKTIPYKIPDIIISDQSQKQSLKGYLSGSRYPIKSHSDFITSLAKKFSFTNPLHIDLFPFVKQMQVQVIHMCARMINFTNKKGLPVGSMNSGGTQSILLCILAYREYKYKYQNVTNPNIVICKTGHVAAFKAADYFDVEIRMVDYDKNYQMDVKDMKSKIDNNTICVYTSYPNYPYGTVDPIEDIAKICLKKKIPVHVDMCLGGFLVPFLKSQFNTKSNPDDKSNTTFKLPQGVTSVSLDPHKYGLSAKGSSISLFSDQIYRNCHMFTTMFWPGGLYGTSGFAGSRSGTPIAASWISMMKMGQEGYAKSAQTVQNATIKLAKQLKILGFTIFGTPRICCIGFSHPQFSISSIQQFMKRRKWNLSLNQKPLSFHFSFTPLNSLKVDQMIKDFKDCVEYLSKQEKNKKIKDTGMLELYGACSKIPDGNTNKIIIANLVDCFLDL